MSKTERKGGRKAAQGAARLGYLKPEAAAEIAAQSTPKWDEALATYKQLDAQCAAKEEIPDEEFAAFWAAREQLLGTPAPNGAALAEKIQAYAGLAGRLDDYSPNGLPIIVAEGDDADKALLACYLDALALAGIPSLIPTPQPVYLPEPERDFEALLSAYRSAKAAHYTAIDVTDGDDAPADAHDLQASAREAQWEALDACMEFETTNVATIRAKRALALECYGKDSDGDLGSPGRLRWLIDNLLGIYPVAFALPTVQGAALLAAEARRDALFDQLSDQPDSAGEGELGALLARSIQQDRIIRSAPCASPEAALAKLRSFARQFTEGEAAGDEELVREVIDYLATVVADNDGAGGDDELLLLGEELETAWTEERAVPKGGGDALHGAAHDKTGAIVDRIERLAATTLAGLRVKARAVAWTHDADGVTPDLSYEQRTTDMALVEGLLADLLGTETHQTDTYAATTSDAYDLAWAEAVKRYEEAVRACRAANEDEDDARQATFQKALTGLLDAHAPSGRAIAYKLEVLGKIIAHNHEDGFTLLGQGAKAREGDQVAAAWSGLHLDLIRMERREEARSPSASDAEDWIAMAEAEGVAFSWSADMPDVVLSFVSVDNDNRPVDPPEHLRAEARQIVRERLEADWFRRETAALDAAMALTESTPLDHPDYEALVDQRSQTAQDIANRISSQPCASVAGIAAKLHVLTAYSGIGQPALDLFPAALETGSAALQSGRVGWRLASASMDSELLEQVHAYFTLSHFQNATTADVLDRLTPVVNDLEPRIPPIPAKSALGLRAKARFAQVVIPSAEFEGHEDIDCQAGLTFIENTVALLPPGVGRFEPHSWLEAFQVAGGHAYRTRVGAGPGAVPALGVAFDDKHDPVINALLAQIEPEHRKSQVFAVTIDPLASLGLSDPLQPDNVAALFPLADTQEGGAK